MIIGGFLGVSLLDYPGKICSIVYTSQCNFRCPFCHNPLLVAGQGTGMSMTPEEVLEDLSERAGFIEAVTVTGGEPLMHDSLFKFFESVKAIGLLTKLDTNGYIPDKLQRMLDAGIIDYVAMDIKTSPEKYMQASGITADFERIRRSISAIMKSGVKYEFRTTAVPGLVEEDDIEKICLEIAGAQMYTIQQFDNSKTLDPAMAGITPYAQPVLEHFAKIARKHVKNARVAGAAARA